MRNSNKSQKQKISKILAKKVQIIYEFFSFFNISSLLAF